MKRVLMPLALLLPSVLAQATNLTDFTAKYSLVLRGSSIGSYERVLSQHGKQYQYDSTANTHFLFFKDQIKERSLGQFSVLEGFQPHEYAIGDAKNRKPPMGITFNQATKTAEVRSGNDKSTVKIPADINDHLSIFLNLQYRLLNQQPVGDYTVIAQGKDKKVHIVKMSFSRKDNVSIKTPLGSLKTIELSRYDGVSQMTDHFYFAPKYQDLLVKTLAKKGDSVVVSSVIESYQ